MSLESSLSSKSEAAPSEMSLDDAIESNVAELVNVIEGIRSRYEVPGVSVATVVNGRTVLCRGFGLSDSAAVSGTDVDEHTLFGIASNTKLFTAVALGILVDEKRLEWDSPVIDYVPEFAMYDSWVTREITVRDLLSHRSGLALGAGDLLWWPPTRYSRKDVLARLRCIKPSSSFRSSFAYVNVLYIVAAEVLERVSGSTWEAFIDARILQPLSMTNTRVSTDEQSASCDLVVARTHAFVAGRLQPVKPFSSRTMNPLGGLLSTAADMAKWAQLLLNKGTLPNGARLFSSDTATQLFRMVTPMPSPSIPLEDSGSYACYTLGLVATDYRSTPMFYHTGGLPGYTSRVTLLPSKGIAVVVLTNAECTEAFDAISFTIADHFLAKAPSSPLAFPAVDWGTKLSVSWNPTAFDQCVPRRVDTRPSLPIAKYARLLADRWYGEVLLTHSPTEGLRIEFLSSPLLRGSLSHWQFDTFLIRWDDRELRADALITFFVDAFGTMLSAKMKALYSSTDFSFDFHDLSLKPLDS